MVPTPHTKAIPVHAPLSILQLEECGSVQYTIEVNCLQTDKWDRFPFCSKGSFDDDGKRIRLQVYESSTIFIKEYKYAGADRYLYTVDITY